MLALNSSHMTIFSKIIAGEIPSYKIYEDELVFAFLDINPNRLGHTLIVPKQEIAYFIDLSDELFAHITKVAKLISTAIEKSTDCKRVGLVVHGMGVPDHFHVHLIPMIEPGDLDSHKAHTEPEEKMIETQQAIITNLN